MIQQVQEVTEDDEALEALETHEECLGDSQAHTFWVYTESVPPLKRWKMPVLLFSEDQKLSLVN